MGPRMSESADDGPDLEIGQNGRNRVEGGNDESSMDAPESNASHLPSVPITLKVNDLII